MRHHSIWILVAGGLLISAVAPAGAAAVDRYRDLTESGTTLTFTEEGGRVRVGIDGEPAAIRPAFELRAAVGERVHLRFPDLPAGWSARALVGPGTWRALRLDDRPGGAELTVEVARERELIELVPPGGSPVAASGYSYGEYTAYLAGLPSDPRIALSELGLSVQGRAINKLIFDDPAGGFPPAHKRTMVVLIRQHGDEWASSFVFEGMLDFLLGLRSTQPAREITRTTRWVFYPLVNPDGIVLDQRWNANGVDLNRDWSATGPTGSQQPEVFLIQTDIGALPGQPRSAGDHHGWSTGVDGGFLNSDGGLPVGATHPAYLEGVADTAFYTAYEPAVFDWTENSGQNGMSRVELYHWLDWVVHTPEYDGGPRDEEALRLTGERYIQAMYDALHGVGFVDAGGGLLRQIRVGDDLFVEVDDLDQNVDPGAVESVVVALRDRLTGDRETVTLAESAPDSGIFVLAAAIPTVAGPVVPQDGILQTAVGARVTAQYIDADRPLDNSLALLRVR